MKVLLTLVIIAATQTATAKCYNFLSGQKHPEQLVQVRLAAPAENICIQEVTSVYGEASTQITLSDDIGALAQFSAVNLSTARCGQDCDKVYELKSGNVNGENVNLSTSAIRLQIQTKYKSDINASVGTLKVSGGRALPETYLIIGN